PRQSQGARQLDHLRAAPRGGRRRRHGDRALRGLAGAPGRARAAHRRRHDQRQDRQGRLGAHAGLRRGSRRHRAARGAHPGGRRRCPGGAGGRGHRRQSQGGRRLQERQDGGGQGGRRPGHEGQRRQGQPGHGRSPRAGETLSEVTGAAIIGEAPAMIELHRVSKIYSVGPVKVPALSDVSFRVGKGEFVTLCGPSGAGKTTLLRLLYREEIPTEGEIEVLRQDVAALTRSQVAALRRSIGIVFQDAKLLPGRTVYENVAFVLRVLGTPRREITGRVFDALRAVGLSSRAQAYPPQLSQGEAQRAALARAVARKPLLLIADEPTGNLDEGMAAEVIEILRDIWAGGTTVLFATHQATLAAALKQRTLSIQNGRLLKDEG